MKTALIFCNVTCVVYFFLDNSNILFTYFFLLSQMIKNSKGSIFISQIIDENNKRLLQSKSFSAKNTLFCFKKCLKN